MASTSWQRASRQSGWQNASVENIAKITSGNEGKKLMDGFLAVLIDRWRKNIRRMNIGYEGDLDASFRKSSRTESGRIKGTTSHNYYGRFVDMGVGNGVEIEDQQAGRAGNRKPKPWYIESWAYEKHRLAEVFQEAIADVIVKEAAAGLETSVPIQL
jgi:hypothetical protein